MDRPKFRIGDRVRVRPGERSLQIGETTYGGWDGWIDLVEEDADAGAFEYLVCWSDETRAAAHPVLQEIWRREMVDDSGMCFGEEQLEPHAGEAPPRESLSEEFIRDFHARDARIAAALGVGKSDEIPVPDEDVLARYHRYLGERMAFPFEAQYEALDEPGAGADPDSGEAAQGEERRDIEDDRDKVGNEIAADSDDVDFDELFSDDDELVTHDVTVLGLVPLEDDDDFAFDGLTCRALEENRPCDVALDMLEVKHDGPNRQLVEDYRYWYDTWSRLESGPAEEFAAWDAEESDDGDDLDDADDDLLDADEQFEIEDYLQASALAGDEALSPHRQAPVTRESPRVGRNDPCPCGSGKKFKKCCLNRAAGPSPDSPGATS